MQNVPPFYSLNTSKGLKMKRGFNNYKENTAKSNEKYLIEYL